MLLITLFGVALVIYLVYKSIMSVSRVAPQRIHQPVHAYDNQFEVFRDMEPSSQVRENPWVGFLQEDLTKNRTGPIGDFSGNDSSSGHIELHPII